MQLPFGLNWIYSSLLLVLMSSQSVFGYEKSANIGVSTGFYNIKEDPNTDKNNSYYSYFIDYTLDDYLLKGQMHHSSNGYFQRYFGLEAGYMYEFDDIYSIYPIIGIDFIDSGVESKLGLGFSVSLSNYFDIFVESKFSRSNPYGDYFVEAGLKFKLSDFDESRTASLEEEVEDLVPQGEVLLINSDTFLKDNKSDISHHRVCIDPYVIVYGDTLSKIARDCKIYLKDLLFLNPKFKSNPDLIYPNQVVMFK
ncbi:LysM peptidoglycan-binding domain-containing protein [Vibrio hyugaensis]|nr:LysM domain-containing protein [Vibrio hyugaensis]